MSLNIHYCVLGRIALVFLKSINRLRYAERPGLNRELTKNISARHYRAAGAFLPAQLAAVNPRPNIVYLHSHDSGRYLQPYGQPVPTPNLQRLASQGILFRQRFSGAPTCSPSRAATAGKIVTGSPAYRKPR
jgi:hypothetical protein